jgi:hypothetical protein
VEILLGIVWWIVTWTIFKPLFGLFEGMVGLLWPADDAEVRRQQRSIRHTILVGLVFLGGGSSVAYAIQSRGVFWLSFGICAICLVLAGRCGRRIEEHWRSGQKRASDT